MHHCYSCGHLLSALFPTAYFPFSSVSLYRFDISYIKWVLSTYKICDKNLMCWPYRRESLTKRKCFAPIICSTWFAQIELCLLQTHKKCNTNNFVHKRFRTEHRLLINRWGWKLKYFRLNFCILSIMWLVLLSVCGVFNILASSLQHTQWPDLLFLASLLKQ